MAGLRKSLTTKKKIYLMRLCILIKKKKKYSKNIEKRKLRSLTPLIVD